MFNVSLAVAVTSITITGGTATALLLGGTHNAPPPTSGTPALTAEVPGMVVQGFTWMNQPDATGYRLYLDGKVTGLVPYVGAMLGVSCGVRHRFNAQGYNNKGVAPLGPPLYFTPSCEHATTAP